MWYHRKNHYIIYDIIYDIDFTVSCAIDIIKKIMISYMISWFFPWYCMMSYNIISILPFLALFSWHIIYDIIYILYEICCDISNLWYGTWNHSIYSMIWPPDISNYWYHCHVISRISWYVPLYHGTCAAGWRGRGHRAVGGASFQVLHLLWPRHRQRAGRSVGTVVQLNGDGLDPAHVLAAVAAANLKFQV